MATSRDRRGDTWPRAATRDWILKVHAFPPRYDDSSKKLRLKNNIVTGKISAKAPLKDGFDKKKKLSASLRWPLICLIKSFSISSAAQGEIVTKIATSRISPLSLGQGEGARATARMLTVISPPMAFTVISYILLRNVFVICL